MSPRIANPFRIASALVLLASCFACWSQDTTAEGKVEGVGKEAKKAEGANESADQLVRVCGVEDAYREALRNRSLLHGLIVRAEKELEKGQGDPEKLAELRAQLVRGRKQYGDLKAALDLVFGLGERREYEYDPVKSTIYLRVGTVEEVLTKAIRSRDALAKHLGELRTRLQNEKDAALRAEIEKAVGRITAQHSAYVRALGMIYGIRPERKYVYNSKDAVIYIAVSKTELETIESQRKELRSKQAAETASEDAAVPDRSHP